MKNQHISFCGAGTHYQNGVIENRIKYLTLSERTLLLHAKRHWPDAITTILWPFSILADSRKHNTLYLHSSYRSLISARNYKYTSRTLPRRLFQKIFRVVSRMSSVLTFRRVSHTFFKESYDTHEKIKK